MLQELDSQKPELEQAQINNLNSQANRREIPSLDQVKSNLLTSYAQTGKLPQGMTVEDMKQMIGARPEKDVYRNLGNELGGEDIVQLMDDGQGNKVAKRVKLLDEGPKEEAPKSALDFLSKNPSALPDFIKKYGYDPTKR